MTTKINSTDSVRSQTREIVPYILVMPINLKDGTELTMLNLRRPNGGEMRRIEMSGNKPYDITLQVVEATCGLTRSEADSLDGADVTAIMEIVLPFLDAGTGAKRQA